MKVLMVGATGRFAGMVVPELTKRGATVRALIQSQEKAAEALAHGAVETAIGNLSDEASLRRAAEGVDGVFHIGPAFAPDEEKMGKRMVEAAKAAGVRRFCFSGVIHPSLESMRNHGLKRPVEEAMYDSGLVFTVLQPTMFMQTLKLSWPEVKKSGKFSLPFSSKTLVSYVDYRDVAEVAAMALTDADDRLGYGTFELSAPGMVDRSQIAAMMGDALGRPVEAATPPFVDWAQAAGIPEGHMREGFEKMYAHYDRFGFPGGNALVLRAILGREPRGLRAFLEELAKD